MKVTILGHNGGFPAKNSNCQAYLIQTPSVNLLIECGSGTARSVQNFIDIKQLDGVLLSHLHNDHFSDILVFRYAFEVGVEMSLFKMLDVYCPFEPVDTFEMISSRAFNMIELTEAPVIIGDLKISFKRTMHNKKTFAMIFDDGKNRIGYTSDTGYTDEIARFFIGCDILIGECTLLNEFKERSEYHMTTSEIVKMAEVAGIQKLILTHFWYQIPVENYFKEAIAARTNQSLVIECAEYGKILGSL